MEPLCGSGSKDSKGVVSPVGDEFYNSASQNGKP